MQIRRWAVIALVVAGVAIAVIASARLGLFSAHDPSAVVRLVARTRAAPHARIVFVGVYTMAAAVAVPVTPFTLAGGALFGPVEGMALNWLADMLAASLAFAVGRVLRPARLESAPAIERLGAAPRGFMGLLRLRVIPVVPFAVLNYGSAFYGMKWSPYLSATALGVIPTTVVYTLFAASLIAGVEGAGRQAFWVAAVSGGAIIVLSTLPGLARRFK